MLYLLIRETWSNKTVYFCPNTPTNISLIYIFDKTQAKKGNFISFKLCKGMCALMIFKTSMKSEVFGTAVCFMCIKINGVGGGVSPIHPSFPE